MAITLVINPGSSSKKYALFNNETLKLNAYIEKSQVGFKMCTMVGGVQMETCASLTDKSYHQSLANFLAEAKQAGFIAELNDITKVAIRVVAPGTYFQAHRRVDADFSQKLHECANLAPLHIPHVEQEIQAITKFLPDVEIIAVSDSAFHASLPEVARLYSLPKADFSALDLYRFGYHGLSVASVARKAKALYGASAGRMIVCHLGSGVSVTALKNGESIETTMGFAPGSGLIMGSRAGDLDAGALLALMQYRNLKPVDAQIYLQTHGGLKGIAAEADLRFLLERRSWGDKAASLAVASFVYQLRKAIGSQIIALNGVDLIVFTATAGERSSVLRSLILENLQELGIELNQEKNEACVSRDDVISADDTKIKIAVLKTDEAAEILRASNSVGN